jgi:hypothetical protein
MRDQVRLDCVDALKLVDAIVGPSTGAPADATGDDDRMATLEAVRQAVLRAQPIPFTDQVRLPARQAADLADRLRRLATARERSPPPRRR